MIFINENNELKGRRFILPDGIRSHLELKLKNYKGDKKLLGYKRLCNILSMKNGIEYSEMKRLKNFFDTFVGKHDSDIYELNGGEEMMNWVNNTLNTATSVIHDIKQAKKDAGQENAFIKSHTKDRRQVKARKPTFAKTQTKSVHTSTTNNDLFKFEDTQRTNQLINESVDDFYEYACEYDASFILNSFLNDGMKGKFSWEPLISPEMYQQALSEFTKYGKLMRFPSQRVYQWMGIIMRNYCILAASTEIWGHTSSMPVEALSDFLDSIDTNAILRDNKVCFPCDAKKIAQQCYDEANLTPDEDRVVEAILELNEDIEHGIHQYGKNKGQYNLFYNQQQVDQYDKELEQQDMIKNAQKKSELINSLVVIANKSDIAEDFYKFVVIDGQLYKCINVWNYLMSIGLDNYIALPDGSDAISDYGLQPIYNLIEEYNEDDEPEQVLVLINKILDVVHCRGDLASAFVRGGTKALTKISYNESKQHPRTIKLTESQIKQLHSLLEKTNTTI